MPVVLGGVQGRLHLVWHIWKCPHFFVITKARNEVSMKILELRHACAKSPSNFKDQDEVVKQLVKLLEGPRKRIVFLQQMIIDLPSSQVKFSSYLTPNLWILATSLNTRNESLLCISLSFLLRPLFSGKKHHFQKSLIFYEEMAAGGEEDAASHAEFLFREMKHRKKVFRTDTM